MPIKLIVNGYYRSGTTFFWGLLKSSILENYKVFYEPLNPYLAQFINKEKGKKSDLHNVELWNEYINLGETELKLLLLRHPNKDNKGINGFVQLLDYINQFNNQEEEICLQTNRLHFHLDIIKKQFNNKNVHIIRHPLDVYNSMVKVSKMSTNIFKKTIKAMFFSKTLFFSLNSELTWINNSLGKPNLNIGSWKDRLLMTNFEKFTIVYTLSNYHALKSIELQSDLFLCYEYLMINKNEAIKDVMRFLDQKENELSVEMFKPKNIFNFNKSQLSKFKRVISKHKLDDEWLYIESLIQKQGISYLKTEQ
ncbi:sulfotransferase domain-containing protein [Winogradskyella ursingii]|uniref:sulfotransferase domain-containing protein n=1 Tax=Winogradskyella ursingii TaxID=2686079 RepID=UPI0015CA93A2|nr:sulfotransferase domain-containing protein [Winogradskyella ursingii]